MADLIVAAKQQSLSEIRIWDIDFSDDLKTGVTVSSATAIHLPPRGSAATPTVGVIASNVVPVTLGPLSVIGVHHLEVVATLSDSEKSIVRIQFGVIF